MLDFGREDTVVLICAGDILDCDDSPDEEVDNFESTASLEEGKEAEEGSCIGASGKCGSSSRRAFPFVEASFEVAITSDEEDGSAMAGATSSNLCDALGCSRAISIVAMVFSLPTPSETSVTLASFF